MICFNLDRSTATQFGKPFTIKEDYLIRNSADWYKRSRFNHKYDIHLCAYSSLLRIVAMFHETIYSDRTTPSGLNESLDFREIIVEHDAKLEAYFGEWTRRFEEDSDGEDKACVFRCSLLPFLTDYSRLVMFSFGFHQAYRRGFPSQSQSQLDSTESEGESDVQFYFSKCLSAATNVIKCVIDTLAPSGYFRYAPDGHFVFASFASAFLLKLLRPEFIQPQSQSTSTFGHGYGFVTQEESQRLFALIGKLIQVLASPEVSIDERHTPKLYARFLAGLLAKQQPGGSSSGRLHSMSRPPQPPAQAGAGAEGHIPPDGGEQRQGGGMGQGSGVGGGGGSGGGGGGTMGAFQAYDAHGLQQQHQPPVPELVQSHSVQGQGQGHTFSSPMSFTSTSTPTQPMVDTPVYEPEATYAIGTGPLELSAGEFAFTLNGFGDVGGGAGDTLGQGGAGGGFGGWGGMGGGMQEEEMLATMHAIKSPSFWEGMMMPGFMWPETARLSPQHAQEHTTAMPLQNEFLGMNAPQQMIPQQMPLHG